MSPGLTNRPIWPYDGPNILVRATLTHTNTSLRNSILKNKLHVAVTPNPCRSVLGKPGQAMIWPSGRPGPTPSRGHLSICPAALPSSHGLGSRWIGLLHAFEWFACQTPKPNQHPGSPMIRLLTRTGNWAICSYDSLVRETF